MNVMPMIVYDAENQILGRMCSTIAKELIKGHDIVIVNVEKAVISGNPKMTISKYMQRHKRGDPIKGPFFPRTPDGICRRAIRGMLPFKKTKGREAFKRLKVFMGVPENLRAKSTEFKKVAAADAARLKIRSIKIGDLSTAVGIQKRW